MSDTRTLRIALLLLAIYVAGLATGWWLAPRNDGGPMKRTWAFNQAGVPVQPGSPEMEAAVMKEFDDKLNLSPEQRTVIRELVSKWALEIRQMPRPLPRLRYAAMERWSANIRTHLTPEQLPAFDAMVETSRRMHVNVQRQSK